jgi:cytoskeletal protein RodZ
MNEENNNSEIVEPIVEEIESKTESQTIGQIIKESRENKNLSLKVISQQTKIHIGLLEHLENDALDKLPSKTYVRGFVKSTAKILGINQAKALDILEKTYDSKFVKKEQKIYHAPPPENSLSNNYSSGRNFNFAALKSILSTYLISGLKIGAVGVLAVVLGINLKNYIKNSSDDSALKLPVVLTTVHQKQKPAPKVAAAKIENKIETPAEPIKVNIIQDNKKETLDKKDSLDKKDIASKEILLKPTAKSEKQFSEPKTKLTPEELDLYLPARFRIGPLKGVETVFINAVDGDSWITYKSDDKDIKKFVLRQGRTIFMRGALVRLFIGNIKNVKVFYNNQYIELNSKTGAKNLVFPEELKDKFLSPLFIFQKDGSAVTSDEFAKNGSQDLTKAPVNDKVTEKATENKETKKP